MKPTTAHPAPPPDDPYSLAGRVKGAFMPSFPAASTSFATSCGSRATISFTWGGMSVAQGVGGGGSMLEKVVQGWGGWGG